MNNEQHALNLRARLYDEDSILRTLRYDESELFVGLNPYDDSEEQILVKIQLDNEMYRTITDSRMFVLTLNIMIPGINGNTHKVNRASVLRGLRG